MRVVLISPTSSGYIWKRRRAAFTLPPMALPLLAAVTPKEVEVRLVDEAVEEIDLHLQADLIGISSMTATAPRAYALAQHFRTRGIPVVMGGIHPSTLPEEALRYCDAVVIGEGEMLWPQVVRDVQHRRLQKIYRNADSLDLSRIPHPRWDLLPSKKYFIPRTVQVTRGCPHGCAFCSVSPFFGRTHRSRPVGQVLEEIRAMPKRLLIFSDDNIIADPQVARELFSAMVPLRKRWVAQCSIAIADDPELLSLAARSGCIGLLIGFESISSEVLRSVGKGINLKVRYDEAIRKIHARGIHIQASFIFGFDGDTRETIARTVQFVKTNRLTGVNYCHLTPFPGTRLFQDLAEEGRILTRDWSRYDRQNIVFQPRHFTPQELQDQIFWAYRQTYNLRSLWQRRPFSFQHLSLYLALNFGYLKGLRRMETEAKKNREISLPAAKVPSTPA